MKSQCKPNLDFVALVCAALVLPLLPGIAFAQGGIVNPLTGAADGTITVYIRDEFGEPLTIFPEIKLTMAGMGISPASVPQTTGNGWVFSDLDPGREYEVEVKADGYQTAYESATLPLLDHASSNVIVFLKPIGRTNTANASGAQYILAPRAEKEVQHGLKDLRAGKYGSAQKHLEKAIEVAPGNPYVNYIMGMVYMVSKQVVQARPYLEKSVSIDPKQPPSLLALGTVRLQLDDNAGAIQVLIQDVQLDATSWKGEWLLANAYLRQRNYEKAREHAARALQVGKENAARAQLLLGQALAGLGERERALSTFANYLSLHPKDPSAANIRSYMDELRKPQPPSALPAAEHSSGQASSVTGTQNPSPMASPPITAAAPTPPIDLPPRVNWAPPDIDAAKPFVISGAACSLPKILQAVGKNAEQYINTLQQFSATEEYQSVEIKHDQQLESPEIRSFSYLVTIEAPRPHVIDVHEIRNQGLSPSDMPGRLADLGAPALVLAFHPVYQDDFEWKCEGLGEWNGKPAWLVHFQQRSDQPTSLLAAYETPSQEYALPLKGRAWVSQNGGHVMHLETELASAMIPIELIRQHFAIDYRPILFKSHNIELWLPESVDVYLQYQGHFIHNYHHYTNFKLFWVGTSEKAGKPKETDQQP